MVEMSQKCINRVATAQGKLGIWFLLFPDRENTGNFVLTQGKYLDCDYLYVNFFKFQSIMYI